MENLNTRTTPVKIYCREVSNHMPTPFFCGYVIDNEFNEIQFENVKEAVSYWNKLSDKDLVYIANQNYINEDVPFKSEPFVALPKQYLIETFEFYDNKLYKKINF